MTHVRGHHEPRTPQLERWAGFLYQKSTYCDKAYLTVGQQPRSPSGEASNQSPHIPAPLPRRGAVASRSLLPLLTVQRRKPGEEGALLGAHTPWHAPAVNPEPNTCGCARFSVLQGHPHYPVLDQRPRGAPGGRQLPELALSCQRTGRNTKAALEGKAPCSACHLGDEPSGRTH